MVMVKGQYRATPPSLQDTQWTDLQFDAAGNLKTTGTGTGGGNTVVSNVAEDGAIGSTSTTGVVSSFEARNAQKTAMSATGDKVNGVATMDGKQVVLLHSIPEVSWQYAALTGGIVSSVADVPLKAAIATYRNYLTNIHISHDTLSAVTEYVIKDGATVILRGKLQIAASEGFDIQFPTPLRGTANTALNFALITSVTGGVFVNAQGFSGV